MDTSSAMERDCPFGAVFQQIINEMKNSSPLWEDFTAKSTKLHSCLRATIQAVTAFLDAFQKIADAATSTKGATKDIGTALTRICLRHKALEAKMKTFTSSLMDCLILPLQEKLEDWKKTTVHLDKEHGKEYKRARSELKKRSIETVRLQKKLRKGALHNGGLTGSFSGTLPRNHGSGSSLGSNGSDSISLHGGNRDLNRILEVALRDSAEKRQNFEEQEKEAIRTALTEERSRFCLFVSYLKPVVDEEVAMLYELTHVQEAMQQLEKHSTDPFSLPAASEQVISDLKGSCDNGAWNFQTPPSSPSSLGSRKSSMCSISSVNSSSSSSAHSPSHKVNNRTIHHPPVIAGHPVGTLRYSSVSSQDSGFTSFTSQDALYSHLPASFYDRHKAGNQSEGSNTSSTASSNSSTPSSTPGNTTMTAWPNLEDSMQFERAACAIMNDRPHTISSAYERGHQRPPLTVYTFQPPTDPASHPTSPTSTPVVTPVVEPQSQSFAGGVFQSASEIYGMLRGKSDAKPPVPKRCSSLERPQSVSGGSSTPKPFPKGGKTKDAKQQQQQNLSDKYAPNVPDYNQSSEDMIVPQPVYMNLNEVQALAASARMQRQSEMELPPPPPELMGPVNKIDGGESNGRGEGTQSGCGSQNQGICVESNNSYGVYGSSSSGHEGEQFGTVYSSRTSDEHSMEMQSMYNSMNSLSTSFSNQSLYGRQQRSNMNIDPLYDIPEGRSRDSKEDFGFSSEERDSNNTCTGDVANRFSNGSGIAYLRQNRHRSSLQHSNSFDFSSMTNNDSMNNNARIYHGNNNNNREPESLPVDTATIHRRFVNPHVPVLDGSTLYNNSSGTGQVGLHRNNSLPRPHSIAFGPTQQYMKHRLAMAKKRDFV